MKKTITSALIALTAFTASAAGSFIVDIDDASHVKFETGPYASAYQVVNLQNGENTVTVNGSDDYRLTPTEGWLIESITGVDENGVETDASPAGWSFNKDTDAYTIWFGGKHPAYKYIVKTKENIPLIYTLNLDINDASAISGGTFRAGNETFTAVNGPQTVTFNANKGVGFAMQLRPAVTEVTFLRNGTAVEPDNVLADGSRYYIFDLTETENIDIDVTMEVPEFFIEIDDPTHIDVMFPDEETTVTNLVAGRNRLTYNPGDELTVVAKEGYRIVGFENMSFDLTTDKYTWRFRDGHSGMEFKATTEEYTPPMAVININIDNPSMISFVRPEGSPTIYTLNEGDNEVKMNLDKGKKLTLSFKTSYQDKFIVAADNKVLELIDDWYTLSAEVEYSEAGNYSVLVRTIKEGDYDGNISCTSASEYKVWTVTFEPCEIIEVAEDMQPYITNSESEENTTAKSVEISGNSAVITFEETPADGAHTFMIPAGTFKINGQAVPEFSLDFDITPSGIGSLQQENGSVARYFNLQGIEIDNPEAGQTVIVIKDGKTHKAIINR